MFMGNTLQWKTDCANVVHFIKLGSMRPQLLQLALQLFNILREYKIRLNVAWIPRTLIEQADYFSRFTDHDDWGVQPQVVQELERRWGKVDIDRFADATNTHCHRFNSRFWAPKTEAVDAFTQAWSRDHNLLIPPIYLIPKVLKYMAICSAKGIMVFPRWEASSYWPEVVRLLADRSQFVLNFVYLGNIFRQGRNVNSVFGSQQWKGSAMALSLAFYVGILTVYYTCDGYNKINITMMIQHTAHYITIHIHNWYKT